MTNKHRQILVTSALPYANGPLHLGFILEAIQTDIWVRFQRLQGNTCYYICGDDAHGAPIMLKAQSMGIAPELLIADLHQEHVKDLEDFYISLDNFYTTHSEENRILAEDLYLKLKQNGDIVQKTIRQAFDPISEMFLPDRYVKGTCPKCGAENQYGDNCEVCGSTYSPSDLINPISVISGVKPIEKESVHQFFALDHYTTFLKEWTHKNHLQPEVAKKLNEWFEVGLQQWDITRDGPYFGFKIPGLNNQYFYVWMDAPIGYMASFKNYCDKFPVAKNTFNIFWDKSESLQNKTELYHFIGKDIIYFHALFWPALLEGSGYRTPTAIFAHGFLTVNGQKMSKSRGTFITARTYLNHFNPEYLRYYFACKLSNGIEDLDINFEDFTNRINSDLVGKLVNIASRTAGFIEKLFEGQLAKDCDNIALYNQFVDKKTEICEHYENRNVHFAMREIMALADLANRYIDSKKPWIMAKDESQKEALHQSLTLSLNLFRVLMIYLQPVLPNLAEESALFLNTSLTFKNIDKPLTHHAINPFKPMIQRIDPKEIEKMIESKPTEASKSVEASKTTEATKPNEKSEKPSESKTTESKQTISIDDFAKIDLRVAKIVTAEEVADADKLVKLIVDIGGETRQIFAGIKKAYKPEALVGKSIVIVANLEPRKMRFGVSEGMLLAAGGTKEGELWIIRPDEGAEPGAKVK